MPVSNPALRLALALFFPAVTASAASPTGADASPPSSPLPTQVLWESGRNGYHTYRIPALATTGNGSLLAFCEGRRGGTGDSGDIDLLLRRSTDLGRTWSTTQVLWNDSTNTCGNPSPVVDLATGTIWLLATWNDGGDPEPRIISRQSRDTRRVFVLHSTDDGLTWLGPREITADVKATNWTWYATGPGSGIQLRHGPHAGRLLVACDHIEADTRHYYSHVIYSDDHGLTWKLGGRTPRHQVNECELAELGDGRLLLNMRNYDPARTARQIAFSRDGGDTWTDQGFDPALVEPICQASLHRHAWPTQGSPGVLLFSNPAGRRRTNLTVRASFDDGRTWTRRLTLHPGPGAYSDLASLPDGRAACLYEGGTRNPYQEIVFTTFGLDDLPASAH